MASLNKASYNPDGGVDSFIASEAMTAYKAVKLNASDVGKIDLCDTAGEKPYGVVDQIWSASDNARVFRSGVVPMTAGAAVTANTRVAVDGSGRAITATSAHAYSIGLAITAATAAGDVISVLLDIIPAQAILTTGYKVEQAAISYADGTTENETTIVLPTKCIVMGAWVDVTTAEATGTTKLIDVGTSGTGSNDPDGFLDGVSVAATGIKTGAPTFTTGSNEVFFASSTVGDLLAPVQTAGSDVATDVGTYIERPDLTSGGETVSWTPSAADWAEFVGVLYVAYIELA